MAITQKKQSNYGVEQMITLKGIEAVRTRPGMYVGSVGPAGIKHIILEVASNSVDEHLVGECNLIVVKIRGVEVTVIDNGRGIPCGPRADGIEALEAACTELHTGAKFTASGETGYNTSGGMNGVGLKCANGLSEYCTVISKRDGKVHTMKFARGIRQSYDITPMTKDDTRGTTVSFKPDDQIFKEGVEIDVAALKNQLKELSFLNKGLVFVLDDNEKVENIVAENGLLDYLTYLNKGKIITSPFYCETKEGQVGVQIAMTYCDGYSEVYRLYTNSIPNSAGTHLTGFKTALTGAVNEYAKDKKLLKDKDENLTGDDLKEGMILALSLIMPDPVFSGQTKDVLTSMEGRGIVQRLISKEIRIWLEANPNDAKTIVNKALLSRKARDAARKARDNTRKKTTVISSVLPGKLADCSSKKPEESEVFIVEGDSAAGTAKTARNRATQAILPVRGKILNVEKTEYAKAMLNEEIKSMIAAFGLQKDERGQVHFDRAKLRYHKIIILSDADVDGAHIQTLFFTFLWRFAPELITEGYVYAAVPPLYKIVVGKETFYLKDDAALEQYQSTHVGKKYTVQRFKGLGEMDSDELAETVMNPANRTLKQITVSDVNETELIIRNLMGANVAPRKKFIEENASRANLDI